MGHIVQFGINLDDESIAEAIKRDAFNEVVKQMADEARKDLPRRPEFGGYGKSKVDWRGIIGKEVEKRVSSIIDEKAGEIVDMAVKRVYASLAKRKAFREACKKMDIIFDGIGGDSDD